MRGRMARHWTWAVAAGGVVLAAVGAVPWGMGATPGLLLVVLAAGSRLLAVRRLYLWAGTGRPVPGGKGVGNDG